MCDDDGGAAPRRGAFVFGFLSWAYNGNELDFKARLVDGVFEPLDVSQFTPKSEFNLVHVTAVHRIQYYSCCPVPFPTIVFEFEMHRAALTYISGIFLPILLITCAGFLGFWLNPGGGERISLGITVLLTDAAIYLVAEARPDDPRRRGGRLRPWFGHARCCGVSSGSTSSPRRGGARAVSRRSARRALRWIVVGRSLLAGARGRLGARARAAAPDWLAGVRGPLLGDDCFSRHTEPTPPERSLLRSVVGPLLVGLRCVLRASSLDGGMWPAAPPFSRTPLLRTILTGTHAVDRPLDHRGRGELVLTCRIRIGSLTH